MGVQEVMDWQVPSGFDVRHGRQVNLIEEVGVMTDKATMRSDYIKAMKGCRQFQYFGIEPKWHPGDNDITGFCHDEVVRQFHDTRIWEDGGVRTQDMLNAWSYAESNARRTPTLDDVLELGRRVEPDMNAEGLRTVWVSVGNKLKIGPYYVPSMLDRLMAVAGNVMPGASTGTVDGPLVDVLFVEGFRTQVLDLVRTVDDWYVAYEWIHPFGDGNGRTGKILHNWLNGTLDDPVLVPDYFGGGNP